MRIAPGGMGRAWRRAVLPRLTLVCALLVGAAVGLRQAGTARTWAQRATPPPHRGQEGPGPFGSPRPTRAPEVARPGEPGPDTVSLSTGEGRLLYRVTVQAEVEARDLRDVEQFRDEVLAFSGELLCLHEHVPDENGREGPLTLRTLEAHFELLGLQAGSTPLTGAITYKPAQDGSLLVSCGRLPEQWGLTWLPQIVWKAYAVRFPLPQEPLAAAQTWGDTVTAVVGASQATMSVHGQLDRYEELEGRRCAVIKGRFEARTRADVRPGADLEEVDVAHVGVWETLYDIEARRTLRQTGTTETVLMRPVRIRRASEPWISTTKVHFTTELVGEQEHTDTEAEMPGQASFARGWELLAPPFVTAEPDATPARNAFQKALQEDLGVAEYHESLALALARMRGQGGRALEEMRRALELDSNQARLHFELGLLLRGARRWDEAADAFAAAAEHDPYNALPPYLEAAMLAELDDAAGAAARIREGNERKACRFYLPPAPSLGHDPSRLGSALGAVGVPRLLKDLEAVAAKCLRGGDLGPLEVAEMGRTICTAHPRALILAMAGMEIEQQALRAPELGDDRAADERRRQLAALGERLTEYRTLLPTTQVMTVGFAAPATGHAAGPPLALPVPLFLDEQQATSAALRAAFGADAVEAGTPSPQTD